MQKHRDTNSTHTHTSCGSGGCAALMRRIVCTGRRWGGGENLTAPFERCRSQNIPGHTERHRHAAPHRQPRKTSRTRASVQAGPTPTPTHTQPRALHHLGRVQQRVPIHVGGGGGRRGGLVPAPLGERRQSSATKTAPALSACPPPARMPGMHRDPSASAATSRSGHGRHTHCRGRQGDG